MSDLLAQVRDALAPLDSKIDHSLYVGTVDQMRADLTYLRQLLRDTHAAIVAEIGDRSGT